MKDYVKTLISPAPGEAGAKIELSRFQPVGQGYAEADCIIISTDGESIESGYMAVRNAIREITDTYPDMHVDFIRYYLSDISNQKSVVESSTSHAISVVGQTPSGLTPSHIAAYVRFSEGGYRECVSEGLYMIRHDGSRLKTYISGDNSMTADSHLSTLRMLEEYAETLRSNGMTLADNCVRTWFFIRDIDVNYDGMVKGRNEIFAQEGLTCDRHYIASTGIGANTVCGKAKVIMDTLAIKGISDKDIVYLKGSTHLNPTHEYGVAFERGVRVDCGDRNRVIISGTASIDNKGDIMWPGDVTRQTERMCENVDVLLEEGGMTPDDVSHIIVYVRDIIDSSKVESMIRERYPYSPVLVVQGSVCRPGWLVEMECMAVR